MNPHGKTDLQSIQDSVTRLFDGDLSEEEFAELSRLLSESPAARETYLEAARLEVSLEHAFAPALGRVHKTSAFQAHSAREQAKWSIGIAAAAVLAIGTILWVINSEHRDHGSASFRVCENSEWSIEGPKGSGGDALVPGSVFTIAKGAVEINLPNDVRAIVEAPASLALVDDKTLRLDHGRAFFRVSSSEGKGFTVVTPRQRVVDLGTAFGIEIRGDGGAVGLHVTEGKVRIDDLYGAHGQIVHAGRSVLMDGMSVTGVFQVPQAGFLRSLPNAVETVFEEDFESGLVEGKTYSIRMDPTIVKASTGSGDPGIREETDWNFSVAKRRTERVIPVSYAYGEIQPSHHAIGAASLFLDANNQKLTDGVGGDPGGWKSGMYVGFEDAAEPVEITFDFGSERHLAELSLHSSGILGGIPVSASLAVSRDGVNYTSAAGSVLPLQWESEEHSQMVATLDISGWPPARYYRVTLESAGQWMFLGEMSFGEAVSESANHAGSDPIPPGGAAVDSPLAIERLQPGNGASEVAVGTPVKVVFSKPVTLGTGSVVVRNHTDGTEAEVIAGAAGIVVEGNSLTVIPPSRLAEGSSAAGHIPGWDGALPVARVNPAGDGTFYLSTDYSDGGRSQGVAAGMRGPTLATFSAGFPGAGIRRQFGEIVTGLRYNVSIAIGSRIPGGADFLGYSVRLKARGKILAELSGDKPPGPPNSMGSVGFSWDSSVLPEGVAAGDPLTIEIAPLSQFGHGYLDFDSVKVTQAPR